MSPDLLLVSLAVIIRILITAAIVLACAWYIIQIRPLPYVKALLIAAPAHLLAKGATNCFSGHSRSLRPFQAWCF